jgi:hypothetical protein
MHCMNADLSDLLRLLQNLIRLGTIAEVKGAKARVRLGRTLTTEWLNCALCNTTRRQHAHLAWPAPSPWASTSTAASKRAANSRVLRCHDGHARLHLR